MVHPVSERERRRGERGGGHHPEKGAGGLNHKAESITETDTDEGSLAVIVEIGTTGRGEEGHGLILVPGPSPVLVPGHSPGPTIETATGRGED